MDELRLLKELGRALRSADGRETKAARIAEKILSTGDYRWVGILGVVALGARRLLTPSTETR